MTTAACEEGWKMCPLMVGSPVNEESKRLGSRGTTDTGGKSLYLG